MKEKPMGMRIGESVFCIGYLLFAAIAGLIFLKRALGGSDAYAAGCAALVLLLGGGDAFHLIPRIHINLRGNAKDAPTQKTDEFRLGLGNLISSITMTIFYILLYRVLAIKEPGQIPENVDRMLFVLLIILTLIRIFLCLMPQNRWFRRDGDPRWGLIRNIPFVLIGLITVFSLTVFYHHFGMALLVTISFICYMAVVLLAGKKPMMGMLMIPKTICYIWMICLLL